MNFYVYFFSPRNIFPESLRIKLHVHATIGGGGGISNFLNSCFKFTEHRPMTPLPIPRANIIIPRIPCPIETLQDQCVMHVYIIRMEDLAVRVYTVFM